MSTTKSSAPAEGWYLLFFDKDNRCLGGESNSDNCEWEYNDSFSVSEVVWLPKNYNPVGNLLTVFRKLFHIPLA